MLVARDAPMPSTPTFVTLAQRLPTGIDEVDASIRKQLFTRFDPNGNNFLSLAELDKGLLVQFKLDGDSDFAVKRCKPAILRAFQAAKDVSGDGGHDADYVTRGEFRLLLVYLQRCASACLDPDSAPACVR